MGWSSKKSAGHILLTTAQTRPTRIIIGLLILCINTKLTSADGKEFSGELHLKTQKYFDNRDDDESMFEACLEEAIIDSRRLSQHAIKRSRSKKRNEDLPMGKANSFFSRDR